MKDIVETSGEYSLVRTKEKKPTIAHNDGKHVYHIHHNGSKIGKIEPYSGYAEKRTPGSRIVSSRKDATRYLVQFDQNKGPQYGKEFPTHAKMGHIAPSHAFESAEKYHRLWNPVKESLDEVSNSILSKYKNSAIERNRADSDDLEHEIKRTSVKYGHNHSVLARNLRQQIKKREKNITLASNKMHEGVGLKYRPFHRDEWNAQAKAMGYIAKPAVDAEVNSGNLMLAKDRHGNTKGSFHAKNGGFLEEAKTQTVSANFRGYLRTDGLKVGDKVKNKETSQVGAVKDVHPHGVSLRWDGAQADAFVPHTTVVKLDEANQRESMLMSIAEKAAVRAATKDNVGAMARKDKEAWIDNYIEKNSITKGALGSAVYSGVMKVRALKENYSADEDMCIDKSNYRTESSNDLNTMSQSAAHGLADQHAVAALHHKKNGNIAGYFAHADHSNSIIDTIVKRDSSARIPSKRILEKSSKIFKDHPVST